MTPDPDLPALATAAAWPLRLAAAGIALWFGALVALAVARRADVSDARVRRSWLATGTVIAGACAWAAMLSAASALAGASPVPLLPAAATVPLSMAATGASLWAALRRRGVPRLLVSATASVLLFAGFAVWAEALQWRVGGAGVAAALLGAAAAQGVTLWLLQREQRGRERNLRRSALAAVGIAAAHALPLVAIAGQLPSPPPSAAGLELLFVVLAAGMAALALQAERMERHLAGRHQVLGAQLQQAHANLERTPLSDPVTGLLSRLGIETVLREAAVGAESRGQRIALLAVGLDGFKSVNDSFGHALGDSVLREVAQRLVQQAAAIAVPPKIVAQHLARLGGDEFVLMLVGPLDREGVGHAAQRLFEALDGPLVCDGHELRLSASIGVACFPDDGGASRLVGRANAAMQAAKAAGGSTYVSFEPRMEDDARDRHELLRDLRHAIEHQQLELFYQPKIDARSGQVTAAEALLRWHHPVRGMLHPDVFVPLAERHGLIGALGNWVIEDACRQARVWRERGLKMRVAINLSVFQMRQNDLVERIQAALKRHGVNPQRLTCEITESVAMEDTQVTQRTFERLGRAGIHLSIDDFGTGYSSLSYLRRLPATELKIDRSFVMDLETNADARAIVDAVLKLAHAIGLKVVAEGVENIRQRDILLELGCDEFQGYLFARPMSARALTLWAVDDRPAKTAFRPSLFAETGTLPALGGSSAQLSQPPADSPLRRRRAAGA